MHWRMFKLRMCVQVTSKLCSLWNGARMLILFMVKLQVSHTKSRGAFVTLN